MVVKLSKQTSPYEYYSSYLKLRIARPLTVVFDFWNIYTTMLIMLTRILMQYYKTRPSDVSLQ